MTLPRCAYRGGPGEGFGRQRRRSRFESLEAARAYLASLTEGATPASQVPAGTATMKQWRALARDAEKAQTRKTGPPPPSSAQPDSHSTAGVERMLADARASAVGQEQAQRVERIAVAHDGARQRLHQVREEVAWRLSPGCAGPAAQAAARAVRDAAGGPGGQATHPALRGRLAEERRALVDQVAQQLKAISIVETSGGAAHGARGGRAGQGPEGRGNGADGAPRAPLPFPRRRRRNLSPHARGVLQEWLSAHLDHPYPSEAAKEELASRAGLRKEQVTNWFINARARSIQKRR